MKYSVSQTAKLFGVSASLLRYYEKRGLLPAVKRDSNGVRYYDEDDLDWLSVVMCMKGTNMSIENIARFARLNSEGDATLQERLDMVKAQKKATEDKIRELQSCLETIDFKVWYFQEAINQGTEYALKRQYYAAHIHKKISEAENKNTLPDSPLLTPSGED